MEIFKSILPVLFFITINSAISLILEKGFGKCLPLTLIASTFIVFLSQIIFKTFIIGLYLLLALFVLSIFIINKNKQNKQYIFTNGFYVFICICLIFLFIDFGRHFFWDDEVGFWGKMVKEMFRLDRFYYLDESTLRSHNDYPPFMQLFEFIWCKLSLGYSECNCTYALHIFEFGLLVTTVFDSYFNDKEIFEKLFCDILLTFSFIGIVVFLDAEDVFNTIYIDTPIALQFAYSIYLVYSKEIENTFGVICYSLSLAMMIMTKQIGLAFFLLSIFYYTINNVKSIRNKKTIIGLCTGILLPLMFYLFWNNLIYPYNIPRQFDFNKISLSGLIYIFKNGGYQLETIKLYINALFKNPIFKSPLPITFISSLILEILILEIVKNKTKEKISLTIFEIVCIVGTFGYALLMLILYTFCYPEREAIQLICYNRYMSSFISGIITSIVCIIISLYKDKITKKNTRELFIYLLLILVVLNGTKLLDYVPQIALGNRFAEYENIAINIDRRIEQGSKVIVVYNHDGKNAYNGFFSYFSDNTFYTKNNLDLCGEDYSNQEKLNSTLKELQQYDYIFIVDMTDSFIKYFSIINDEELKEMTLYKVNHNEKIFKIEEVH